MTPQRSPSRMARICIAVGVAASLAAAVLAPRAIHAQQADQCGVAEEDNFSLEHFAPIFTDSEYAEFRQQRGITEVPPAAPRETVRDAKVCQRLLLAARKAAREVYRKHLNLRNQELVFLRYGAYYAVVISPKHPPGASINGYGQVLIFRADTLEYLGFING